jgi:hypothetical protein
MGLFGKKTPPDRASNPARKSTASSASDWMQKKPVNTPETQQAEATAKWKSDNNNYQNGGSASEKMVQGIEKSMAEKPKSQYNSINTEESKRM